MKFIFNTISLHFFDCMNSEWNLIAEIEEEAMAFFKYVHESIGNEECMLDNKFYDPNFFYNKPLNINIPRDKQSFLSLIRNRIDIRCFRFDVIIPFLNERQRTYFLVNGIGKNTTFILGYIVNGKFVYRPYLSKKGYGILDKYVNEDLPFSVYIPSILKDINRLLKFSSKCFSVDNEFIIWDMMELFLLIITSERFRSDKSNLLVYTEFFKFKSFKEKNECINALILMFKQANPSLKFAQKANMDINNPVGGVKNILNTPPEEMLHYFKDMINYTKTPYLKWEYDQFAYNFYLKHLDRLKAIFENRYPDGYSNKVDQFSIRNVEIWATPIDENTFQQELGPYY